MLLCIQFLPRMAIVKFDVENRSYACGGLTSSQQKLICSSDLLTGPGNLAANTRSSEVGVELFYFLKTRNRRKNRCRMRIKQCGRLHDQLNPSVEHFCLFLLLLASCITQSEHLCIQLCAYVSCMFRFFVVLCCWLQK